MDVFIDWAHSWARREIIKHAIRLVMPFPESVDCLPSIEPEWGSTAGMNDITSAVFAMGAFERFVFVMSLLERLSDEECSVLLGCAKWDIKTSRIRALKRLSRVASGWDPSVEAFPMRLPRPPAGSDHWNRR
jgi:DNA-directed RNA polymerase specialized sigma24 family protein